MLATLRTMFTQEHVIATLKEHFEARNDVATVYLFGSYATGNVRRRSDVAGFGKSVKEKYL